MANVQISSSGMICLEYKKPSPTKNNLFLDKDGVLVEVVKRGSDVSSARTIDEISLCSDLNYLEEIKAENNLNLVVVSNQPDLSRGLISIEFIIRMSEMIALEADIDLFIYCPHLKEDNCDCRKPGIGMIEFYRKEYCPTSGQDWFVGDREVDKELARRLGFNFYLVAQPHNEGIACHSALSGNGLIGLTNCL